ncbi:MAG: 7-cyano-7-deazaguanine synthase QueC [Phycisphaerales bacterium]
MPEPDLTSAADPAERRAVVLRSGGLDSAVALAMARRDGRSCVALSFDYAQRHRVELNAARHVAEALGAERHVILNLDLRPIGASALTADIAVPKDRPEEQLEAAAAGDDIPVTYVPGRNLIFLSCAAALAEASECAEVWIGVNAIDYSGYPDCRPAFIEAFQHAAELATRVGVEGRPVQIRTPLATMTKADIVRAGVELGVDLSLTHSCYDPTAQGRACGHCDACLLRARGFREAGRPDPALEPG